MNPRRGFLAMVGGSMLSGLTLSRASATTPTLILPTKLDLVPTGGRYPLPAAFPTEMQAILNVKGAVPADDFQLWLSIGLRMADAAEQRGRAC